MLWALITSQLVNKNLMSGITQSHNCFVANILSFCTAVAFGENFESTFAFLNCFIPSGALHIWLIKGNPFPAGTAEQNAGLLFALMIYFSFNFFSFSFW